MRTAVGCGARRCRGIGLFPAALRPDRLGRVAEDGPCASRRAAGAEPSEQGADRPLSAKRPDLRPRRLGRAGAEALQARHHRPRQPVEPDRRHRHRPRPLWNAERRCGIHADELGRLADDHRGTASASATYERSAQRFAGVRAARDAEIRAASCSRSRSGRGSRRCSSPSPERRGQRHDGAQGRRCRRHAEASAAAGCFHPVLWPGYGPRRRAGQSRGRAGGGQPRGSVPAHQARRRHRHERPGPPRRRGRNHRPVRQPAAPSG